MKTEVPISQKLMLTIEEAAAYSNVGENKIRELIRDRNCDFVLKVGTKNLIKREKFSKYLENKYVI